MDPWHLTRRAHPVAFVDLVYTGETLGRLISFLYQWSRQLGENWDGIKRNIRIIGITARMQAGADTWRWQQHTEWVTLLQRRAVKNVSISEQMWCYLGEDQAKVTRRYGHRRWGTREAAVPQYDAKRLEALRLAAWLFDPGREKEWRRQFARRLSQERAMIYPWFRRLVLELKGLRPPALSLLPLLLSAVAAMRGGYRVQGPDLRVRAVCQRRPSRFLPHRGSRDACPCATVL